jgi:Carboxypeptidase regulatory-like domain
MILRNRLNSRFLLLPLLLAIITVAAHAQQNSEIVGTVTDKQGAVVSGAKVSLTEPTTGLVKESVSNESGLFSFPGLNLGTYDLKVSATGFETFVQQGLQLNVSQTLRADAQLTVGSVSQTVTVAANAIQVQADSNVVSTLINADQIANLATENRNFAALAALGLGVSSALPANNTPTSVASNFTISVNGLRQSHNIWLIDGGEADDRGGAGGMSIMPSQDAIAQFETLSSNYPPDYGISSGATITLGIKSGTQNFHGGLWEFNRNTAYNANSYFNKQASPVQPRTKLNYNIFGGNIGGPIFIPGHYNVDKQRTFFFFNLEERRLIQGSSPNSVQTLAAADYPVAGTNLQYVAPAFASSTVINVPVIGDPNFNAKLVAAGIPVPVAGQKPEPWPNQVIPASFFDPNAIAYLNTGVVPKPNLTNGDNISSANQPIYVTDYVLRVDHKINDKYQLLGHYLHDAVNQSYAQPMLGWSGSSYPTISSVLNNPSYGAVVKLTGTLQPNLLIEATFNYDGNIIDITNSPNSLVPAGWSVNNFFNNGSKNLPGLTWGAPYGTHISPGSAPWKNAAQDYSPIFSVSYTEGKHAMKFGFGYNRYTKNQQLFGEPGSNVTFGTLTGDSFMDMVLGLDQNYDQTEALPIRHYVNQTTSGYVMDNWKVTPRLSLQLGLRYDALPHAWERNNQVSNFNPALYVPSAAATFDLTTGAIDPASAGLVTIGGTPFYLNGIYQAGQNGYPRGLVTNYYNTLQPRVGFSDDLFGDGKTVLRGGIGWFYERLQGNDIYNAATNEPFYNDPTANSVYFSNPKTSFTTGGASASPIGAQGLTNLNPYYPAPAVTQFSLGVQREVKPSVIWVVQYIGNIAWHQNIERQINTASLATPLLINPDAAIANYTRANLGDPGNNSGTNPSPGIICPSCGKSITAPNSLRTYPGFAGITQEENTTNGTYNGFQTGLRGQNWHGLSGEVDYTWSHEIDITTYDLATVSNPFNLKYDKGSGALDRRNILSINYIYNFPNYPGDNAFAKQLLNGWQISGTAIFESGVIINNQGPGLGLNYDPIGLDGGYTNRPNINWALKSYPKKQKEWFNPNAFSSPLPAWAGGINQGFGDARKDAVLGPGQTNFNTSFFKTFPIHENVSFKFRFETFNTWNHTEFQNVGNNYNVNKAGVIQGNFGQITSTMDPRVMELGGQLTF